MDILIQTDNSALIQYNFENFEELIAKCIKEVDSKLLERPEIKLYGKICRQNRSIGFFSNTSIGYSYSGQLAKSQPVSSNLQELLEIINKRFDTDFNGILVNRYASGCESIGAHSDDERFLDPIGVISLSVGAVRNFRIRDKNSKKIVANIPTFPNTILHMTGDFQKEFTHEIPVQKLVSEPRYSLTFRKHVV